MKKSELKKILKPIVEECIRESLFKEGALSTIIKEVLASTSPQIVTENQAIFPSATQPPKKKFKIQPDIKKQLEENKKTLEKATGLSKIFENVNPLEQSPIRPKQTNQKESNYGALRDVDPADAGINISGIIKLTGGWKA